jgi:hypothetical protein
MVAVGQVGHENHLLEFAVNRIWWLAEASSNGGTTEARRGRFALVTASLICAAFAAGNSDHKSAIVPVTNGTATLVPPSVSGWPPVLKLVTPSPGALKPRLPIELPKFDSFIGLP